MSASARARSEDVARPVKSGSPALQDIMAPGRKTKLLSNETHCTPAKVATNTATDCELQFFARKIREDPEFSKEIETLAGSDKFSSQDRTRLHIAHQRARDGKALPPKGELFFNDDRPPKKAVRPFTQEDVSIVQDCTDRRNIFYKVKIGKDAPYTHYSDQAQIEKLFPDGNPFMEQNLAPSRLAPLETRRPPDPSPGLSPSDSRATASRRGPRSPSMTSRGSVRGSSERGGDSPASQQRAEGRHADPTRHGEGPASRQRAEERRADSTRRGESSSSRQRAEESPASLHTAGEHRVRPQVGGPSDRSQGHVAPPRRLSTDTSTSAGRTMQFTPTLTSRHIQDSPFYQSGRSSARGRNRGPARLPSHRSSEDRRSHGLEIGPRLTHSRSQPMSASTIPDRTASCASTYLRSDRSRTSVASFAEAVAILENEPVEASDLEERIRNNEEIEKNLFRRQHPEYTRKKSPPKSFRSGCCCDPKAAETSDKEE